MVKGKDIVIDNRPHFNKFILELEDGKYTMKIEKHRKIMSDRQRKYYFGFVVKPYAEAAGYTKEEAHDILGWLYRTSHYEIDGVSISKTTSTTKINTKNFEIYLEQCRKHILDEVNVICKLPNETEFNY